MQVKNCLEMTYHPSQNGCHKTKQNKNNEKQTTPGSLEKHCWHKPCYNPSEIYFQSVRTSI